MFPPSTPPRTVTPRAVTPRAAPFRPTRRSSALLPSALRIVAAVLLAGLLATGCVTEARHAAPPPAARTSPDLGAPANEPVDAHDFTPNVMAPLLVGDPARPDAAASREAWARFERDLAKMRAIGVRAVSTDVWWGLVEGRAPGEFAWAYYDRLVDAIERADLRWVPILSFHACGGNVGDDCDVPLPAWVWTKHVGEPGIVDEQSLRYRSERGRTTAEVVSVFGTRHVLEDYERFARAFAAHYAPRRALVAEVSVSLGPAGELRYPSYGAHDPEARFPSRGALQAYSELAKASLRAYLAHRYAGHVGALDVAWGASLRSFDEIGPPGDADGFFARGEHLSAYGRDLTDWYADALLEHGRAVIARVVEVLDAEARGAFRGVDVGVKVPGIHWRMTDGRLAEVAAGLLRTRWGGADWDDDARGHGYAPLLAMMREAPRRSSRLVLHFTCLEKGDGEGGPAVGSRAGALVRWVAREARRQGLPVKGENAIADALVTRAAWDNMREATNDGAYDGLTILRMTDVAASDLATERYAALIAEVQRTRRARASGAQRPEGATVH